MSWVLEVCIDPKSKMLKATDKKEEEKVSLVKGDEGQLLIVRSENEEFVFDGRVHPEYFFICMSTSTNPSMAVLRDAISLLQY